MTCENLFYNGTGTLRCTPQCTVDTSGCSILDAGVADPGDLGTTPVVPMVVKGR